MQERIVIRPQSPEQPEVARSLAALRRAGCDAERGPFAGYPDNGLSVFRGSSP
jgi:hypothetical protein